MNKVLLNFISTVLAVVAVYWVLKGFFHYSMNPWECYTTFGVMAISARQMAE